MLPCLGFLIFVLKASVEMLINIGGENLDITNHAGGFLGRLGAAIPKKRKMYGGVGLRVHSPKNGTFVEHKIFVWHATIVIGSIIAIRLEK